MPLCSTFALRMEGKVYKKYFLIDYCAESQLRSAAWPIADCRRIERDNDPDPERIYAGMAAEVCFKRSPAVRRKHGVRLLSEF